MLYKMKTTETNLAFASEAVIMTDFDDIHNDFVNNITRFGDIKNTSQKAYRFYEEALEYMREFERCSEEAKELFAVFNDCVKDASETENRVEKYIALMFETGKNKTDTINEKIQNNRILPQYKATNFDGVGTSGIETDAGYQQVGLKSGTVAEFNGFHSSGRDVSCTFTTLYQLHKKGLGFPFNGLYGTSGKNWINLYDGPSKNKYAGADGLDRLVNEYIASEQTEPLENVVVSFDSGEHGHVLLIDHIDKNGMITFKDQSLDSKGTPLIADEYSTTSAMQAIDSDEKCPWQHLSIEDFKAKYSNLNCTVNGAIIMGTP